MASLIDLGGVFILGDSYSTFEGYIPKGYDSWYWKTIRQNTDVDKVEQTWWKMLLDSTKSNSVLNCSWSGTPICHTGYGGDWSSSSFITRFDGFFKDNEVNTVFLFGGTNDSWADSPIGELLFSDWIREDLFSVLPAFCYLLNRIKQVLPSARIICIINTDLKQEITDGFKTACDKLGVEKIELENIEKQSGHPNRVGMEQIYKQVLNYLKKTEFKSSPFVELKSGQGIEVEMQYPLLKMENAVSKCYVRQEVCKMLIKVQNSLPDGLKLKVLDAWRPFALQKELFEKYSEAVIKQFSLDGKPEEEKQKIIGKYVSLPVDDRELAPLHTTGGAVDVTLVDACGNELAMGTEFDAFCEKTRTDYYEAEPCEDSVIRENRRILYRCMTLAGFTNLPSEWWHFDYGNKSWAYYNNTAAIYKGVFTEEEIICK